MQDKDIDILNTRNTINWHMDTGKKESINEYSSVTVYTVHEKAYQTFHMVLVLMSVHHNSWQ